jgi:hypothetical protein
MKCVLALCAALIVFFVLLFTAMKVLTRAHMPTFLKAIRARPPGTATGLVGPGS